MNPHRSPPGLLFFRSGVFDISGPEMMGQHPNAVPLAGSQPGIQSGIHVCIKPIAEKGKPSMTKDSEDFYRKARTTAVSLLAKRRHTGAEICRKLSDRGFEKDIIEQVLTECRRLDYINDETAADFFVEELNRKQVGVDRVREAMKQHGFDPDLIRHAIESHDLQAREMETAKAALEKKEKSLVREQDPRKKREKLARFLRSRGFRPSTIAALLNRPGPENGG